jgi:parallel beta-helix repeat protein
MNRIMSLCMLLIFVFAVPAFAVIIRVPQDYPTIQQGIDAANGGDIVVVAPGTYYEEITLKADVIVRGAGQGLSIIHGGGNSGDVVFASGNDIDNDTKFMGFTVTGAISGGAMPGGAGIFCNSGAKPDISNNRLEVNDFGIVTWNQSNAYIHNNVVVYQTFDGIVISANPTVINNTVVGNRIGINDGGGYGPTVMNNIVTASTLYGIYALGTPPVLTYNDVWNNATNYQNCSPGIGSISADPVFLNPPDDYHLQPGSPCIDTGNPAAQYNDPDGTRNDMGAYGGPDAAADFPRVELTIPMQNEINLLHNINISAMFNMPMDSSTFNINTVRIYDQQSGFIGGSISYDSTGMLVTFDPDIDLRYGETVTALLTKCIESISGDSLEGFTWQFVTRIDSGSGLFVTPSFCAPDNSPHSVIAGDFNNDGNYDIAVVNESTNNVSILLGNGDGSFDPAVHYETGTYPCMVRTHDFNSDGNLDIAVTNESSQDVSILLGTGDGTFNSAVNYAAGNDPHGLACHDINIDGIIDLVVTNFASDTISTLLGNGDGSFASPDPYPTSTGPYGINAGDFNNDGYLDIVTANITSNNISVLIGNGDGSFNAAVNYSVGQEPYSVVCADLNEDGDIDLVAVNNSGNSISRLLGNGDGTFSTAANYSVGSGPRSAFTSDFNADGHIDIAVANTSSNNISILLGNGNGGFGTATNFSAGDFPIAIVGSDFDNDQDIDLATANYNADSVAILLNESALNVTSTDPVQNQLDVPQSTDINATFSLEVDTSTLNNSTFTAHGALTGMHTGTIIYSSGTSTVSLDPDIDFTDGEIVTAILSKDIQSLIGPFLGGFIWDFTAAVSTQSDGTFENPLNFPSGNDPRGVFAADFDSDLDIDIAATSNPNSIVVLLNNGDGTFGTPVYTAVQGDPIALYGADLDADGDIDLASAHNQPGTSHLVILKNDGNGVFTVFATYAPAILGQNLAGGDIDADNDIDLVMTDGWGSGTNVRVMLNNGNGGFSGPFTYTAGTWARGIAIKDVDNDGDLDLGVTNAGNDNISILLNDGTGDFPVISNYAVGANPTAVFGNDLNGDNYVDFATANYSGNDIAVILNNGDGTFSNPAGYATGSNTRALHGGDFDGDGDIDLTGSNNGTNTVAVLMNNGDGTYANLATYTVGTNPWGIMSADYDLDGALDIACGNYNSNNITVLYNSGVGIQEYISTDIAAQLTIHPNPFRDQVDIKYCTGYGTRSAQLIIYDICGRLVRKFSLSAYDLSKPNTISWNGTDEKNRKVSTGVYFCQLRTDETTLTNRMILIK